MPDQWYWKHRGDVLGPLDTEDLESLVRQHRVSDRDQVRLADSDEWLTGSDIKSFFASKSGGATSAIEAARLLSQSNKIHESPSTESDGFIARIVDRLQFAPGDVVQWVKDHTERIWETLAVCLSSLKILVNRYVLLAISVTAFVIVIVTQVNTGIHARNRRALDELTAAWQKVESLPATNAESDGLKKLRAELLPGIDATLDTLMRDAKSSSGSAVEAVMSLISPRGEMESSYARKALIQSTLALKAVLIDPAERPLESTSADIFRKQLKVAQEILNGQYQVSNGGPTVTSRRATARSSVNVTLIAFLTLDALLLIGGVVYWLRAK